MSSFLTIIEKSDNSFENTPGTRNLITFVESQKAPTTR